jgi:dihydrofolate synthase/folylpolyglutamate synthase
MNIEKALEKLYSLRQMGVKLGLENIKHLLAHLGNPQNGFKSIHVAGSNGKGSTASFIASILMEAGFRVGLFTSPHYVEFNERIKIDGVKISNEYIAGFIEHLSDYLKNSEITFFEISTALGFKYFNDNKVDVAVIETGLGGRLDATNTINPIASVITSISLEHTKILGDTIEKIAYEKAGIIKNNIPVFIGDMPFVAGKVLNDIADERHCQFFCFDENCKKISNYIKVPIGSKSIKIYKTPLRGYHQIKNAALAILTVNKVMDINDSSILIEGINRIVGNLSVEGRYEIYSEFPKIIFDSAHNPEGMQSFIDEFELEKNNYKERIAVFGAMSDKNLEEMFKIFSPHFTKIYITAIDIERAASVSELKKIAEQNNINTEPIANTADLIKEFGNSKQNNCLVVFGSIYLLGEVKSQI